jgi:hypothetical protein
VVFSKIICGAEVVWISAEQDREYDSCHDDVLEADDMIIIF